MALTKFEKDMNIIAPLDNEPNDVGGLSAEQLKAKFDEGNKETQKYINETLTAEIDQSFSEADTKFATKTELQNTVLGQIPDGTITPQKLNNELQKGVANGVASLNENGVVPISQGGTDASTAAAARTNLCITDATVPISDDVATALGLTGDPQVKDALNKIKTLIDGNTTLANSKAKVTTGSYTGTGTYGSANPNSLTFDFVPKILIITQSFLANQSEEEYAPVLYSYDGHQVIIDLEQGKHLIENDTYKRGFFYVKSNSSDTTTDCPRFSLSNNDKTVSWYSTYNAAYQFNVGSVEGYYGYIAIG